MSKEEKLRHIRENLVVLYDLQYKYGCRTLDNVIQNLEADAKFLEKEV